MNNVYQPQNPLKPGAPSALVIVLACASQLMIVLDGLVVSVALPQMRLDLGLSPWMQQWIVNGYLITFGGLLMVAARAADLIGHRQMFIGGIAVFTLASLAGGLAHDATTLVLARVVQGVGAAALAPGSLSLLTATHSGEQRARAVSIWSATSASAAVLGLVLGGLITSALGWRWVLLINIPIGILLGLLAAMILAPSLKGHRQPLDLPGAVTMTLGAGSLTYGIAEAGGHGLLTGRVGGALLFAVLLLGSFVIIERRSASPLVPFSALRHRNIILANAIIAALGAIMTATLYFLCLYQQQILGHSPLRTGLSLVPMSTVLALGAIASKSLLPRFGARGLIGAGGLVMAVGLFWLATLSTHSNYVLHILGPTLVWAAGASIVTMPCIVLANAGIDPQHAGLASGLVNTARQTGGAMGLAALATIASTATTRANSAELMDRVAAGYGVAFIVAGIFAVLVSVLALAVKKNEDQ